jgi:hypothetical protein
MIRMGLAAVVALTATSCRAAPASITLSDPRSPLKLERIIALPNVKGRLDHLALDPGHRHLFVAEYGNGSVDEIDLESGRLLGRISGLHEPQGVACLNSGEIVVASGDGSVRFYAGDDRHEVARVDLGDDADNVRVDARNGRVVVGYGNGGLAVIDPATHHVIARMALPGHPESFQLLGPRVLVNVPGRGSILAGNIDEGRILLTWSTGAHRLNFPLSIDPSGRWFTVAYRLPAALAQIDIATGRVLAIRPTCGDADDLFIDGRHIYIVCGAGHVDVVPEETGTAGVRIATAPGARTGLFSPDLRTLFVAAPARRGGAAIWVLHIGPAN